MYAPSSKITQTCLFLSYYSLLIIDQMKKIQTGNRSIVEVRNKHVNGDDFPDFTDLFFLGLKNVRVGRKHTYLFLA
jgi:hypothetical protein